MTDPIYELIKSQNAEDVKLGIILGLKERDKAWWLSLHENDPYFTIWIPVTSSLKETYEGTYYRSKEGFTINVYSYSNNAETFIIYEEEMDDLPENIVTYV